MKAAPITVFLQRKLNTPPKMLKHCFLGGSQLKFDICFWQGVFEPHPGNNLGIIELEYILFKYTLASYSAS